MNTNLINYIIFSVIFVASLYLNLISGKYEFISENDKQILKLAKTAHIKAFMNPKIDPCVDFYKYACNRWHLNYPTQFGGQITTDQFQEFTKGIDRRLNKMLNAKRSDNNSVEDKIRDFYDSCLLAEEENQKYGASLRELYREIGEFSTFKTEEEIEANNLNFKWWTKIGKIQNIYGKSIILAVYIMNDLKNKSKTMAYISQPEFELVESAVDIDIDFLEKIQEYRIYKYLTTYLEINKKDARKIAKNALAFENDLNLGGTDLRSSKTPEDLFVLYNTITLIEKYKNLFDMKEYLETVFDTKDIPKQVYVYDESYLENLYKVFNTTEPKVVEDYILWVFLEEYLIDVTSKNFEGECVDKTKKYFGKYIDHVIYNTYRSKENENALYELWDDIKETFKFNLLNNKYEWITNQTRHKAIEKLYKMNLTINSYDNENFEENLKNLKINASNYVINVKNILAHTESLRENKTIDKSEEDIELMSYTPMNIIMENEIKIPVAVLQKYVTWDINYPKAIQYGTLGFLIGHEMIHGFDDEGRKHDAIGSLYDWWDKKSEEEFEKRRQCFEDQYHKYIYNGIPLIRSALQGENIADNGGINIAYDAYKRWLSKQKLIEDDVEAKETLPKLNLNNKQLFFLSYAQIMCEDVHSMYRSSIADSDLHAPSEIRVIGSLSNSKEFNEVYKCEENKPMNPKEKCEIY